MHELAIHVALHLRDDVMVVEEMGIMAVNKKVPFKLKSKVLGPRALAEARDVESFLFGGHGRVWWWWYEDGKGQLKEKREERRKKGERGVRAVLAPRVPALAITVRIIT